MKNRIIKFRAWDTKYSKWYKPDFRAYLGRLHELMISLSGDLSVRTIHGFTHDSLFPDRYILNQYTGLKDSKGKEIYEGDIVLGGKKGVIEWIEIDTCFAVQTNEKEIWTVGKFKEIQGGIEVIGNIYESPKLIK